MIDVWQLYLPFTGRSVTTWSCLVVWRPSRLMERWWSLGALTSTPTSRCRTVEPQPWMTSLRDQRLLLQGARLWSVGAEGKVMNTLKLSFCQRLKWKGGEKRRRPQKSKRKRDGNQLCSVFWAALQEMTIQKTECNGVGLRRGAQSEALLPQKTERQCASLCLSVCCEALCVCVRLCASCSLDTDTISANSW